MTTKNQMAQTQNVHRASGNVGVWDKCLVTLQDKASVSKVMRVIFAAFAGYATFKYLSTLIYRKWKGYPKGPFVWPVFGSAFGIFSEKFWMQQCGLYGAITYCNVFGINMLIINDSKVAKSIIFNKKEFNNRANFRKMQATKMSETLTFGATKTDDMSFLHTNGSEWKIRRQYAMVSLIRFCDSKYMSKLIESEMNNVGFKILNEICDKNDIWYPSDLCYYFSLNTVYHANFGHSLDINDPKLIKLRESLSYIPEVLRKYRVAAFSNVFYRLFNNFINGFKRFEPMMNELKQMYIDMIVERYEYFKSNPTKLEEIINDENNKYHLCYIDYLVYMMYFKDNINNNNSNNINGGKNSARENAAKLTDIKVINDLHIMFFAATDTTSSTLQFGIFLLAKSVEIQEMLYNKLKIIQAQNINRLELKDLNNCNEFRAFIFEVLRISSVAPFGATHYLGSDKIMTIDNKKYFLPGNSLINTNITYMHRGEDNASKNEHWKNKDCGLTMEDICLENWLVPIDDKGDDNNNNTNVEKKMKFKMNESFINFGYGARDCVGQQLAIKEINLILGYLILNYRIRPENGNAKYKLKRNFGIVTTIDSNEGVRISKRRQNN